VLRFGANCFQVEDEWRCTPQDENGRRDAPQDEVENEVEVEVEVEIEVGGAMRRRTRLRSEEWVGNSRLLTENFKLPTPNCQLQTLNCQLPTANSKLKTANCNPDSQRPEGLG
jgi:hypothetical protein